MKTAHLMLDMEKLLFILRAIKVIKMHSVGRGKISYGGTPSQNWAFHD